MKTLLFLALLTLGGTDCVQPDYISQCPLAIDPNMVQGAVLPPDPNDPNNWQVEAGKFNREAEYLDCERDYPVDIRCIGGTVDPNKVTVTQDREAKRWSIAVDLPPGDHYLQFEAVDSPEWRHALPAERWATVVVEATEPPNTPPVLH